MFDIRPVGMTAGVKMEKKGLRYMLHGEGWERDVGRCRIGINYYYLHLYYCVVRDTSLIVCNKTN